MVCDSGGGRVALDLFLFGVCAPLTSSCVCCVVFEMDGAGGGVFGGQQSTQNDLSGKRKEFEHYKNRAQTEMAISLQVHIG